MSAAWQCAVCETVNHGGRNCSACGAAMTLRSAAVTSVRARVAPVTPPAPAPLPEPVRRAINREPVDDDWDYDNPTVHMIPIPGGCLVTSSPRRRVNR